MIRRSVKKIAEMLESTAYGNVEQMIEGVQIDSRQVDKNSLFIPMIGQKVDGHSFVEEIKDRVGAVLWQKDHLPYPEGIPYILVEDTTKALQLL